MMTRALRPERRDVVRALDRGAVVGQLGRRKLGELFALAEPLKGSLEMLMSRVAGGDRDALKQLYDATSSKLFGLCIRILGDREEAEDVLQDVYVTVWRRADRFDAKRASAITWLTVIARNRAIDRLRARGGAARSQPIEGLELADGSPSAEARLQLSQEGARLAGCLDQLDARTAQAIRTAFFDGVTYDGLAQRSGAPLGTVKSWIRRGLLKLKGCLES